MVTMITISMRIQGAVVIWFSDDPALNEQTRWRLMEASDRLRHTDLVVVENTFNREKFEAWEGVFSKYTKTREKEPVGPWLRAGRSR